MNSSSKFYKSIVWLALITSLILVIPLIAMQFSNEVVWTFFDFVVAGAFLFITGLLYILVTQILAPRMANHIVYRVAVGFALGSGLFLIWSNLAVGIIGSEDNAINLIYFGVIAVGIIGSFTARFQSKGLAFTMFAMAIAQALAAGIALIAEAQQYPGSSIVEIIEVNGFFILLFVISALLFRHTALEQHSSVKELDG